MARAYNGTEGIANGTVLTTGNSGGGTGNTAYGVVSGSPAADTTRAMHGSVSTKFTPASGAASSVTFGSGSALLGGTKVGVCAYFYMTALPTTQFTLIQANETGGGTLVRVNVDTAGKILFATNSGGTTTTRFTTTNAFGLNQWNRIEFYADVKTSAGILKSAYFVGDGTTPVESNTTTGLAYNDTALRTVSFGKVGTDTSATAFWGDDFMVDNAATDLPGPYTEALATPVLSFPSIVNPTTGQNNGSITATWPAVAGATSYVAYMATTNPPAQGDFTQVAVNVTSPYVFANLGAGVKTPGIMAKA